MSTITPRITVIIPNLNRGPLLEQTLCSVIDQDDPNLELIVMDGGSDDESLPLLHHYEDDLTFWRSVPDRGAADAVNHALRCATGEIVCILHAGDLLLPGALRAAAEHASSSPWCVGRVRRINEQDEHLDAASVPPTTSLAAFLTQSADALPISGAFFRRELLLRHGGFDPELRHAWGYEMTCRLLTAGVQPAAIPQAVAALRERAATPPVEDVLADGREHLLAIERYTEALPLKARMNSWQHCDECRDIYALAESESRASNARCLLWAQLLKRPSWLANHDYRRLLLRDATHAAAAPPRLAAA